MRDEFEMPGYTAIGLQKVETHGIECAVEIEPDEDAGDGTYYIARVYLEGTAPGQKRRWYAIGERNPLHQQIARYAYDYRRDELEALWADYLEDHPIERRKRRAAVREHGTHWGRP